MVSKDWLVTDDGNCQACKQVREWKLIRNEYRFHRFLTEVEDVLNLTTNESSFLPEVRRLVRQLVLNSYWIRTQHLPPCPETGTSVLLLYDEIGYPLTVQTVTLSPGAASPIHNHGTWGVVAVLKGQERNTFWRRTNYPEMSYQIERVGEQFFQAGDIISFTSGAIHSVQAMGDEPTITFNIYGEAICSQRLEFDPIKATAKNF
jgi:predicted metal-dependent enzyme (double-stranded beta helix superfamily)